MQQSAGVLWDPYSLPLWADLYPDPRSVHVRRPFDAFVVSDSGDRGGSICIGLDVPLSRSDWSVFSTPQITKPYRLSPVEEEVGGPSHTNHHCIDSRRRRSQLK